MSEILSDKQREFLARRRPLIRSWPVAGGILLAFLAALLIWMFWRNSLLVNPFSVLSRIERDALEPALMALMAGILPIVMLVCFLLVFALLLFMFTAFSNERRYQKIIRILMERIASLRENPGD